MNEEEFWGLIQTHLGRPDVTYEDMAPIQRELVGRSLEDALDFARILNDLRVQTYNWELWGAAYIINGGCSDDGFEYFRMWLIAQGPVVLNQALSEPDSLAALFEDEDSGEVELEDLLYLVSSVYREKTDDFPPALPFRYPELGDSWDFDDHAEMLRRYPRLCAIFWPED